MNDSDSDNPISKMKEEVIDENEPIKKRKSKNKTPEKKLELPDNLTLTADKMMKKELNLLHGPVNMNVELPETNGNKAQISHKSKRVSVHALYSMLKSVTFFNTLSFSYCCYNYAIFFKFSVITGLCNT